MRHVGDVHLQLEVAVVGAADGDRIVEVARSLAVDGDDGQRAIVAAMPQLRCRDHRLKLLRLLQYLDRKTMRQMELADDDLDIDAEIVLVAKNLKHASAWALCRRRPLRDLHFNDDAFQIVPLAPTGFAAEDTIGSLCSQVSVQTRDANLGHILMARRWMPRSSLGAPLFPRCLSGRVGLWRPLQPTRNDDFLRDLLVHGRDIVVARAVMECPDNGRIAAREHAQDASFGTAIVGPRALAREFHENLIAMHCRADGRRRDKDIARDRRSLSRVRDDEAIAVAVHGQPPGDQVLASGGVLGQRVAVAARFD